jgi:BASS family bile acid:Na+ symporter
LSRNRRIALKGVVVDVKALIMLAFQVSVISTVFGFGLRTKGSDLLALLHRPGLLIRSLLAILVIMPALAFLLVRVIAVPRVTEIVLASLAISPIPPLLPQREAKGGTGATFGLGLMALLGLLSIVTVPLTLQVLGAMYGRTFGVSTSTIAGIVLKMALLPLAAGIVIRAVLPAVAERLAGIVSTVAKGLLVLATLVLLAGTWRLIWNATGSGSVVAMIVFVAIGLAVGHVMGGPELEHSAVLALSTACRHPVIALTIASANFPDERFGAPILLYILVNVLVGAVYFAWARKKAAGLSLA